MIDRVQFRLEKFATELDSYLARNIFTEKQIEKIVETRRSFENKLDRSSKKISDFVFYIDSEKKLEKIRNRIMIKKGIKTEESDLILQNNIIKIYQRALFYFNEPILLKDFVEYCIKRKAFDRMKKIIADKCRKNLTDIDLWIFCAQKLWEIGDIDGARGLFMKALAINTDQRLYIEFFRLEVLYCQKLNSINIGLEVEDDDKDELEKGKVALIVLEEYVKKFGKSNSQEFKEIAKLVSGLESEVDKLL